MNATSFFPPPPPQTVFQLFGLRYIFEGLTILRYKLIWPYFSPSPLFYLSLFLPSVFFFIGLIRKFGPQTWRDITYNSMLEVRTLAGIRRGVFSIHCALPLCPLWLTGLAAIQVNLHRTRHSHHSETKQLHIDIQRSSQHTQRARPRGTPLVNSDHGWEHSWQKHLSVGKKKIQAG